jgi:hypothetical protein
MLQKWPNLPGALVRGQLREKLKEISWWEQIIQPSGRTNGNCENGSGEGGGVSPSGVLGSQLGSIMGPAKTSGESSCNQCSSWGLTPCVLLFWWCENAVSISWGLWWGVYGQLDLESALDGNQQSDYQEEELDRPVDKASCGKGSQSRGMGPQLVLDHRSICSPCSQTAAKTMFSLCFIK